MSRRYLVAALLLVLLPTAMGASPAAAKPTTAAAGHKLVVVVKKTLTPATEKKLAVLVLVTQNGGPASGAVATASKPLTVRLANRGLYRVKAEIDASCKGTCAASHRISGAANHKLEVVPSCRLKGSGFVCSNIRILKVY